MPTIWVARLSVSSKVGEKLRSRHRIEPDEVRDAVQCRHGLVAARDVHPDRGERYIIRSTMRGRPALIVVYPVADSEDEWRLGSAYFDDL